MRSAQSKAPSKYSAEEAFRMLEQAWAYYTPETQAQPKTDEPELFQYANAA